jgi:hypothetical protein
MAIPKTEWICITAALSSDVATVHITPTADGYRKRDMVGGFRPYPVFDFLPL